MYEDKTGKESPLKGKAVTRTKTSKMRRKTTGGDERQSMQKHLHDMDNDNLQV